LYAKAGAFVQAGRLFESQGKREQALEAYAAVPAGAVDAARLHLVLGQPQQAAGRLSHLTAAEREKIAGGSTLPMVARVMLETGRVDEALRVLQGLKRRGSASGAVHLLLGRAFLEKGMADLAEEELRVATSLPLDGGDETRAAYLLGCVLEQSQ